MDKKPQRTEISEFGEFGLIDHLTRNFDVKNKSTLIGVGDDAAIIDNGKYHTVVSTDLLIEGIHFDLHYHPLKHLGYKAVVVNLSDIYAMNAIPGQVTISLALSNRFSVEAVDEIYSGVRAACDFYKVDLVGGDTTSSQAGLIISVTAIGQVTSKKKVLRSTANKGDLLCVTGDLGAAYLGLQLLEREKQVFIADPQMKPDLEDQNYIVGRQLKPEARADMITQFDKAGVIPTSMIDVSDGLSSDLMHICKQSGLGAIVEESGVPIHPEAQLMAIKFKLDPITCALSGGEDYELLFTINPRDLAKVRLMTDIYIMGEMVEKSEGIKLHTKGGNIHELQAQGWKHF